MCVQWHALTREEQAKYYELARKERQLHMQLYPTWSARDNYVSTLSTYLPPFSPAPPPSTLVPYECIQNEELIKKTIKSRKMFKLFHL